MRPEIDFFFGGGQGFHLEYQFFRRLFTRGGHTTRTPSPNPNSATPLDLRRVLNPARNSSHETNLWANKHECDTAVNLPVSTVDAWNLLWTGHPSPL